MKPKGRPTKPIPTNVDFTKTLQEIADTHSVSVPTAHRWKRQAGGFTHFPRTRRSHSMWIYSNVTPEDWAKGDPHVAGLVCRTPNVVWAMRQKLNIPKANPMTEPTKDPREAVIGNLLDLAMHKGLQAIYKLQDAIILVSSCGDTTLPVETDTVEEAEAWILNLAHILTDENLYREADSQPLDDYNDNMAPVPTESHVQPQTVDQPQASLEQLTSPKPQSTELIPLAEYQRVVKQNNRLFYENMQLNERRGCKEKSIHVAQPILPSNPPTAFKTHGCEPPAHAFGSHPECGVHITDKDENVTCIRQEGYVGPGIKGQTQGIPGGPSH